MSQTKFNETERRLLATTALCRLLKALRRLSRELGQEHSSQASLRRVCRLLVEQGGLVSAQAIVVSDRDGLVLQAEVAGPPGATAIQVGEHLPAGAKDILGLAEARLMEQDQPTQDGDSCWGERLTLVRRLYHRHQLLGLLAVGISEDLQPVVDEVVELFTEVTDELSAALFRFRSLPEVAGRFTQTRLALIEYAADHGLDQLLTRALDEVSALMQCRLAFFHLVNEAQSEICLRQVSSSVGGSPSGGDGELTFFKAEGLWEECLRRRAPVIHNHEILFQPEPDLAGEVLNKVLLAPVIRDGKVVAVISYGGRARDFNEEDSGPVLFLSDVIWELVRQKRTQLTHERLLHSIEQVSDMVMITDLEGRIEYVNAAFEKVTGYNRAEVLGRNPRLLKSGRQEPELYAQLWSTLQAGQTFSARLVNRRKDGSLYTEQATISPVKDPSGRAINYVAVKRDISKQIELEQQLQQSSKMESVGRLAGGIAHDFNNMLNVILGHSELALDRLNPGDPFYLEFKEIRKAGMRSAVLTRQLLAFARRQTVAPEVLDLNRALDELSSMLRRLMGEDIDLVWRAAENLWPVKLDPAQVSQILVNLCVNARDAIAGNGKVTIETANVQLDQDYCSQHPGARPGDYVMLAVSDDGHGMDAATRSRIFEPFFTTKPVGEGTGLGLATVYGVVKQNGGFIYVYSEVGEGTTFKIYLARHHGELASSIEEEPATLASGVGQTILVVEDDRAILKLAHKMLDKLSYKALLASTPGQALDIARTHPGPIDLLLTDVIMPEMNGRELAGLIREHRPELQVLFMSGYTANVIAHHGVLEEGVHFLGKPFTVAELAGALQGCLPPSAPN